MTEPTAVTGFLINLLPVPSIIFFSISVRISSNHNLSGSAVVIIMSCGCRRRRHDVAENSEIFPSCSLFVKLLPCLFLTIRHLLNEGFCNQWMNLSAPSTGQLIQILGDFLNAHCWINAHQHFWGSMKKKEDLSEVPDEHGQNNNHYCYKHPQNRSEAEGWKTLEPDYSAWYEHNKHDVVQWRLIGAELPRCTCRGHRAHGRCMSVTSLYVFAGQAMQIKGYRRGFRLRLLPDDGITCAQSLWRTVKFVPIVSDMQKMWRLPSYARLSAFTEHEPQTVTVTSRNVSRQNFWIIMVNIFDTQSDMILFRRRGTKQIDDSGKQNHF